MRVALCLLLLTAPVWAEDGPRVLFSPDDDVEQALVSTLKGAKTSVDLALVRFPADTRYGAQDYDEFPTALDALRVLARRGVRVRVVVDRADRQAEAVRHMLRAGLAVFSVTGSGQRYCVIDEARAIHGSADWTQDAYTRHHAAWVITQQSRPYQQAFAALLARARPVTLDGKALRLGEPVGGGGEGEGGLAMGRAALVLIARALRGAKTEVLLAAPSIPLLAAELEAAGRRGVRVRVLVDQPAVEAGLGESVDVRALTYSLAHDPARARSLRLAFVLVDRSTLIAGSFGEEGSADARRCDPRLAPRFRAEHERLWALGRDRLATFMTRLKAAPSSRDYRRFVPCHFPAMALRPEELKRLRDTTRAMGFTDAAGAFWHFDREARAGTNAFPKSGHEPFFGLERLVISEVCYRPKAHRSGQYVELVNATQGALDLRGYVLADGDSQDALVAFQGGATTVAPGATALVVDPDFDGDFLLPEGVCVLTTRDRSLGNGLARGDVVSIRTPTGRVLDTCPLEVDTQPGQVLRRLRIGMRSYPGNWTVAKPSPGIR